MNTAARLIDRITDILGALNNVNIDGDKVTVLLADGGTVTAEPVDEGWGVEVRDDRGTLNPHSGAQSSYWHRSTEGAALAVALAVIGIADRASEAVRA